MAELDKYRKTCVLDSVEKYSLRTPAELAAWDIYYAGSDSVEEAKQLIMSNELKHISDKFRKEVIDELDKIPELFNRQND